MGFYFQNDEVVAFASERAPLTYPYDYLGAGLPVVIEDTVGNAGDALNVGAAELVPYNDAGALIAGGFPFAIASIKESGVPSLSDVKATMSSPA